VVPSDKNQTTISYSTEQNHCIRYYGYLPQIQTLLHHEPMEWKSDGDDNNGGGEITELLTAPPAITSSQMGLSHTPSKERELMQSKQQMGERAGSTQTTTPAGEMGQEGIELTLRAYRSRLASVGGYLHVIKKIVLFANSFDLIPRYALFHCKKQLMLHLSWHEVILCKSQPQAPNPSFSIYCIYYCLPVFFRINSFRALRYGFGFSHIVMWEAPLKTISLLPLISFCMTFATMLSGNCYTP